MRRAVLWDRKAIRDLQQIAAQDRATAQRISAAVEQFSLDGTGDVRKLSGGSGEWRLRVGDWRCMFTFENSGQVIAVSRVLNRRDAYR